MAKPAKTPPPAKSVVQTIRPTAAPAPAKTQMEAGTPNTASFDLNVRYLGMFEAPYQGLGSSPHSNFQYGGFAPAYHPANDSLFLCGNPGSYLTAEITIPDFEAGAAPEYLQPFGDMTDGKRYAWQQTFRQSQGVVMGGQLVLDDNMGMAGSVYEFFDAGGEAFLSHWRSQSLVTNTPDDCKGLARVGVDLNVGFYAGYMAKVPVSWQGRLKCKYVTGQALISILSRTSCGPSLHGFDPMQIEENAQIPASPLVYYHPHLSPTIGGWDSTVVLNDPMQSVNGTCRIGGVVMVDDLTLFIGMQAPGPFLYSTGGGFHGPWQPEGIYLPAIWVYHNEDLEKVVNNQLQAHQVIPRMVFNPEIPTVPQPPITDHFVGARLINGVAWDPVKRRAYVWGYNSYQWPRCYVLQIGDTPQVPTEPPIVVINDNPVTTGNWYDWPDGHGGSLKFAQLVEPTEMATWEFDVVAGNSYRICATWQPHPNRAMGAPYRIYDGDAMVALVRVNQEEMPATLADEGTWWHELGIYPVTGTKLKVTLSNDADEFVIADAVRIEKV